MKIAISGKGGVGKTTFCAILAHTLVEHKFKVLAVDADPDANLGQTLGFLNYQNIIPISEMKELINERTLSNSDTIGTFFKLNPTVYDLPNKLSIEQDGIHLMVMGTIKKGGSGCICPASTMLKTLTNYLILLNKNVLILDMEAGLEHLGRGTARGVNFLIIIVEPGQRSVNTALNIRKLANDINLTNIFIVGNKIRSIQDKRYLQKALKCFNFLGFLDYDDDIIKADIQATCPSHTAKKIKMNVSRIAKRIISIITIKDISKLR